MPSLAVLGVVLLPIAFHGTSCFWWYWQLMNNLKNNRKMTLMRFSPNSMLYSSSLSPPFPIPNLPYGVSLFLWIFSPISLTPPCLVRLLFPPLLPSLWMPQSPQVATMWVCLCGAMDAPSFPRNREKLAFFGYHLFAEHFCSQLLLKVLTHWDTSVVQRRPSRLYFWDNRPKIETDPPGFKS